MKKRHSLKKNEEFARIIQKTKPYKFKDYIFYLEWNDSSSYFFGISVGKKIGNAVTRNKYKRRIKSILDKRDYKNGFNCIIILRNTVLNKEYQDMELDLLQAVDKLKMTKEHVDEEKK